MVLCSLVLWFLCSLALFFSVALVLQFYGSLSSSLVIMVLWLTSSLVPLFYDPLILWPILQLSGSGSQFFCSLVISFSGSTVVCFSVSLVLWSYCSPVLYSPILLFFLKFSD